MTNGWQARTRRIYHTYFQDRPKLIHFSFPSFFRIVYGIFNYAYRLDFWLAALVEALSAVVLIGLFLLQKFGTSRVSFLFSPIMGAWTLTTPMVGIYSIIKHYPGIFKAISPHYMVNFFCRKQKEGWLLLGGIILCITGLSCRLLIILHESLHLYTVKHSYVLLM